MKDERRDHSTVTPLPSSIIHHPASLPRNDLNNAAEIAESESRLCVGGGEVAKRRGAAHRELLQDLGVAGELGIQIDRHALIRRGAAGHGSERRRSATDEPFRM